MEKLKNIIKWIGTDGLLHFMVCYAMMLAFTPITGWVEASCTTALAAALKEAYDYFVEKDNDGVAVAHDFACDAVGYILACVTILIQYFL